ncbi:MAG: Protein-L-isoaspartate O-methyltransferase, partial [uncultured Thermoleophilia bacterium]
GPRHRHRDAPGGGTAADRGPRRPRPAARAGCRRAPRPARRGHPRHARVLPRARADHAAADRRAGVRRRGGGGRLARRGAGRPLRPRAARRRRRGRGPGVVQALPDVDVAERRRAGPRGGAAGAERARRRPGPARRVPRARPLQPSRLDGVGGAPALAGRSRGGAPRPGAVRLLRPRRPGRAELRLRDGLRRRRAVRPGGHGAARRRAAMDRRGARRRARAVLGGAERACGGERRALLPGDGEPRTRVVEPPRHAHGRDARGARRPRPRPRRSRARGRLGAQLASRRRAGDGDGGGGAGQRGQPRPRAPRLGRGARRVHDRHRAGHGRRRVGRTGSDPRHPSAARRELRGAAPRARRARVHARPRGARRRRRARRAAARAGDRRDLPRRDRAAQPPLPRRPARAVRRAGAPRPDDAGAAARPVQARRRTAGSLADRRL